MPDFSPDAARPAGGKLAPHVPPLHDGGLSDLAVDEKVVEGERRQRDYSRCDQLEVASLERENLIIHSLVTTRVRNSNLGLCFFAFKCCVSQLSVERFGKNLEGVMTLGQVKSSPNFCSFGPQRAEEHNI